MVPAPLTTHTYRRGEGSALRQVRYVEAVTVGLLLPLPAAAPALSSCSQLQLQPSPPQLLNPTPVPSSLAVPVTYSISFPATLPCCCFQLLRSSPSIYSCFQLILPCMLLEPDPQFLLPLLPSDPTLYPEPCSQALL